MCARGERVFIGERHRVGVRRVVDTLWERRAGRVEVEAAVGAVEGEGDAPAAARVAREEAAADAAIGVGGGEEEGEGVRQVGGVGEHLREAGARWVEGEAARRAFEDGAAAPQAAGMARRSGGDCGGDVGEVQGVEVANVNEGVIFFVFLLHYRLFDLDLDKLYI